MPPIIYFILVFAAVSLVIFWLMRKVQFTAKSPDLTRLCRSLGEPTPINPEQVKKHKENLGQIVGWMANSKSITNQETQNLLKVSAATAERYLEELQRQGHIEQVDSTGQSVYYRIPPSH